MKEEGRLLAQKDDGGGDVRAQLSKLLRAATLPPGRQKLTITVHMYKHTKYVKSNTTCRQRVGPLGAHSRTQRKHTQYLQELLARAQLGKVGVAVAAGANGKLPRCLLWDGDLGPPR